MLFCLKLHKSALYGLESEHCALLLKGFSKTLNQSQRCNIPPKDTFRQVVMIPHQQENNTPVGFNFRQFGFKEKSPGRPKTSTESECVAVVTASFQRSPRSFLRKLASVLHMSYKYLHRSLDMHPYKIMVVQEFSKMLMKHAQLCVVTFSKPFALHLSQSAVMKHISIYRRRLINKTFASG